MAYRPPPPPPHSLLPPLPRWTSESIHEVDLIRLRLARVRVTWESHAEHTVGALPHQFPSLCSVTCWIGPPFPGLPPSFSPTAEGGGRAGASRVRGGCLSKSNPKFFWKTLFLPGTKLSSAGSV